MIIYKYILVGILNTSCYILITILLVDLFDTNPILGSIIGFIIAMTLAFSLNRNWTFNSNTSLARSLRRYFLISLCGIAINTLIIYIVVNVCNGLYYFGLFLTIIAIPTVNYLFIKKWAFGQ